MSAGWVLRCDYTSARASAEACSNAWIGRVDSRWHARLRASLKGWTCDDSKRGCELDFCPEHPDGVARS